MNVQRYLQRFLASLIATGMMMPVVRAGDLATPAVESRKPAFGTIVGIIKSATRLPVAGATVTAARLDGSGIRATVSGSDGLYSFADVSPGGWMISSQADGFPDGPATPLEVIAGKATRSDILMSSPATISSVKPAPGPVIAASAPSEAQSSPALVNRTGQSASIPNPTNDSVWRRWSNGQGVNLNELKRIFAPPPSNQPTQTASLRTPASAFDHPAADLPEPGPFPSPQPAPVAPAAPPKFSEALELPDATVGVDNFTPFAFGDFTWLNGSPRTKDTVLDTKFFTPEVRFDTHFMEDFNQPIDHTIVGATESFRSGEIQVEQISVGGDFHWQNVRGRILIMDGLFASTTPRNDASAGVGQWDLRTAYRYVSEAYGGYHFNVQHGLNVDAGIFVSYIGLFSYYNFDNWTYQPSFVSSNTPWFFNGLRVQWFPTNKLKIEPWVINGWQSYARYNGHLGLGGQLLWMPNDKFKLVANQYGFGEDNLGLPHTQRIHTDDSIEYKYYDNKNNGNGVSKMAFSLTGDLGCQYGGGISCTHGPNQSAFLGWMLYDRIWWHHDLFGLTLGGGQMSNPGRYLTLLPPINGADAVSGSPYFTENPGQKAHMWDSTITLQYMPRQYITWFGEVGYRHSDIPYFAGRGGVTPPGGNTGVPNQYVCAGGGSAGSSDLGTAETNCGGGISSIWFPDLRRSETKITVGVMVKF